MLDLDAIQSAVVTQLPRKARWIIDETPVDYDFSVAHSGLLTPSAKHFNYDPSNEWQDLLIFGEFAHGGGGSPYLCIRKSDSKVVELDVERMDTWGRRGEAIFLLNSSINTFIDTWLYLNSCLAGKSFDRGESLPPDAEQKLLSIDPEAYSHSEWKALVDHLKAA